MKLFLPIGFLMILSSSGHAVNDQGPGHHFVAPCGPESAPIIVDIQSELALFVSNNKGNVDSSFLEKVNELNQINLITESADFQINAKKLAGLEAALIGLDEKDIVYLAVFQNKNEIDYSNSKIYLKALNYLKSEHGFNEEHAKLILNKIYIDSYKETSRGQRDTRVQKI